MKYVELSCCSSRVPEGTDGSQRRTPVAEASGPREPPDVVSVGMIERGKAGLEAWAALSATRQPSVADPADAAGDRAREADLALIADSPSSPVPSILK